MMLIHDYIQKKWEEYEYCNMRAKRALRELEHMGRSRIQAGGGVTEEEMREIRDMQAKVREKLDALSFDKINQNLDVLQRIFLEHRGHGEHLQRIKSNLTSFQSRFNEKVDALNAIQDKINSKPKV